MPVLPATEIAEALDRSVRHTLETMCFAEAVPAAFSSRLGKRILVSFRAGFAGSLDFDVAPAAARALATALLGSPVEEIPPCAYIDDTICELGTVICGHFLSALDPTAALQLEPARLVQQESTAPADLRLGFQLEQGPLAVSLRLG